MADNDRTKIFNCIAAAFQDAGLNKITSEEQSIAWGTIPGNVIDDIADAIQQCIKEKIKDPGDLIGPINAWAGMTKVMPVKTLIDNIRELMK
jgi:hypothetical protein